MLDALREAIIKVVNDTIGRRQVRFGQVLSVNKVDLLAEVQEEVSGFVDTVSYKSAISQEPVVGSQVCYVATDDTEAGLELMSATELLSLSLIVQGVKLGVDQTGLQLVAPLITFNEGNNGGLLVAAAVVARLNRLEQRMATHQHIVASPGAPTLPDPATNTPMIPTQVAEVINPKITH